MTDCLIVGAGVVGLSLAYELAQQGARVRCIDAGLPGAEASWAGAGILPPAGSLAAGAVERLTMLSNQLHRPVARAAARRDRHRQRLSPHRRSLSHPRSRRRRGSPASHRPLATRRRQGRRAGRHRRACPSRTGPCAARHSRHLLLSKRRVPTAQSSPFAGDPCRFGPTWRRGFRRIAGRRFRHRGPPHHGGAHTGRPDSRRLDLHYRWRLEQGPGGSTRPAAGHRSDAQAKSCCWPSRFPASNESSTKDCAISFRGAMAACWSVRRKKTSVSTVALPPAPSKACSILPFRSSPRSLEARVERSWAGLRPVSPDGRPYLGRIPGYDNAFLAAGHGRAGLATFARHGAGHESPDLGPNGADRFGAVSR